jgi:hypothetical protein
MMNLGDLQFKAEDFATAWCEPDTSSTEMDVVLAAACARVANRLLRERLGKAPEVFGKGHDDFSKHDRWAVSQWVNIHDGMPKSTHHARLVCIEELPK